MIRQIQDSNRRLYQDAQQGAAQAAQSVRVWETALVGIGRALSGISLAFVGLRAINFAGQFSAFAEQLNNASQRTGILVEDLHALERAAKASEVSFEDLNTGFRFLARTIAQAQDSTSEQARVLRALGITAKEPLSAFLQLADQMKNNLSVTDRYLATQLVLGRSSEDLIVFLSQGSEAIRQQMEEMKRLGVVSQQTAEQADKLNDEWQKVKDTWSIRIGEFLIADLVELNKQIINTANTISSVYDKFRNFFNLFTAKPGFRGAVEGGMAGLITAGGPHTEGLIEEPAVVTDNWLAARIKAQEEAKAAAEKAQKQAESFTKSLTSQNEALALQIIRLTEGEQAADEWKIKLIEAEAATLKLTAAQASQVEKHRQLVIGLRELREEEEKRKILGEQLIALGDAEDKQREQEKQDIADLIRARVEYNQTLREHQLNLLRAAGAPEQQIMQREIEARREQIKELESLNRPEFLGQLQELQKQQDVAQLQMLKLKDTSIDVAGEVARAVTDITTAVIQGTLKWADIGRSILASFVRVAMEQFTTFLRGMQQASQATQLLAGAGVPAGGGAGGGAGGMASIGNILPTVGGMFTTPMWPGGFSLGGLGMAGGLGWGFGGLIGSLFPGGQRGGSIGGLVGSLGGSLLGSTALGASIGASYGGLGAILGGYTSMATSGILGGQAAASLGAMVGTYAFPIIGTIIGAIIGGLISAFTGKKNPTAVIGTQMGVNYNQVAASFELSELTVSLRRASDLGRNKAHQVAVQVHSILAPMAQQWIELLNVFPDAIAEQMIPALDITNQRLNANFGRLKFSEGGSRNIQQELQALSGREGQLRFLDAFLAPFSAGIQAALNQAGLSVAVPGYNQSGIGALGPPASTEEFDKLREAMASFAQLSSSLATISSQGVKPFLTARDLEALSQNFKSVVDLADPALFIKGVEALQERIKPIADFLQNAMTQSSELFGRGLIAALEAATESEARETFFKTLATGVKENVFQGLTEAFIASAQFTDLLAPIQQTIRDFTQQAIETGVPPDLAAFRNAILPQIEAISARGTLLFPLIDIIQQLGEEIRNWLGLMPAAEPAPPAPPPTNVVINLNGVGSVDEASLPSLARRINNLLEPQLSPRA